MFLSSHPSEAEQHNEIIPRKFVSANTVKLCMNTEGKLIGLIKNLVNNFNVVIHKHLEVRETCKLNRMYHFSTSDGNINEYSEL